jgi:AcrR family transcriptional regulator
MDEAERHRARRACLDCVGTDGFAATTVAAIVGRAGLTREAFYAFACGKTDGFRDAVTWWETGAFGQVQTAAARAGGPAEALRAGVAAALRIVATDPAGARCWLVERAAAGVATEPAAVARREAAVARAAATLGTADLFAVRCALAALEGVAREAVLGGRAAALPGVEPELVRVMGTTLGGSGVPRAA